MLVKVCNQLVLFRRKECREKCVPVPELPRKPAGGVVGDPFLTSHFCIDRMTTAGHSDKGQCAKAENVKNVAKSMSGREKFEDEKGKGVAEGTL